MISAGSVFSDTKTTRLAPLFNFKKRKENTRPIDLPHFPLSLSSRSRRRLADPVTTNLMDPTVYLLRIPFGRRLPFRIRTEYEEIGATGSTLGHLRTGDTRVQRRVRVPRTKFRALVYLSFSHTVTYYTVGIEEINSANFVIANLEFILNFGIEFIFLLKILTNCFF